MAKYLEMMKNEEQINEVGGGVKTEGNKIILFKYFLGSHREDGFEFPYRRTGMEAKGGPWGKNIDLT